MLHFCPALNGTFVMLAVRSHLTEVLAHIDRNGKVLQERLFENAGLEHIKMISEAELIVLHPKDNLIIQWNLLSYQLLEVPFMFDEEGCAVSTMYLFPDTQTFCVVQQSEAHENRLTLSYFHYPLRSEEDVPYMAYEDE